MPCNHLREGHRVDAAAPKLVEIRFVLVARTVSRTGTSERTVRFHTR